MGRDRPPDPRKLDAAHGVHPSLAPLLHLISGIEKRTPAETRMPVNPSAHKSRYILLSCPVFCLNFSLTNVCEAIQLR